MRMTVLRAHRSRDFEPDLIHRTNVPNIDRDDYGCTVYGQVTLDGKLVWVVLDNDTCRAISELYDRPFTPGSDISTSDSPDHP